VFFASLLADGRHSFRRVPVLRDIDSTHMLLEALGCELERDGSNVTVNVSKPDELVAPYDLVRKMRASILCLGPMLARYGEARVSLPGGCAIGSRPIDLHVDTMRKLGAEIDIDQGYVIARAKRLIGERILFEKLTVGGTENALMAAVLAKGTTVIENAAKEPEVIDLVHYLRAMGAKIEGEGTSVITIDGVDELHPASHSIVADRIEAGTLLIAGAITGGEVTVTDCVPEHLEALTNKMRECGFAISTGDSSMDRGRYFNVPVPGLSDRPAGAVYGLDDTSRRYLGGDRRHIRKSLHACAGTRKARSRYHADDPGRRRAGQGRWSERRRSYGYRFAGKRQPGDCRSRCNRRDARQPYLSPRSRLRATRGEAGVPWSRYPASAITLALTRKCAQKARKTSCRWMFPKIGSKPRNYWISGRLMLAVRAHPGR
jgi:hypothetical protein